MLSLTPGLETRNVFRASGSDSGGSKAAGGNWFSKGPFPSSGLMYAALARSGPSEALQLLAPRRRRRPHQPRQGDPLRIVPPVQDALHDVRREQGEAQHPRQVGRVDLLRPGQLLDRAVLAAVQHPLPAMGASQGLHQRAVNASRSWCQRRPGPALGRDDLLSATLPAEGERHLHRHAVPVAGQLGCRAHATSLVCVSVLRSWIRLLSPSVLSRIVSPSGATSTRSTRSCTMRACSAGNSSSQSGSSSDRAALTSPSPIAASYSRAARQVRTITSGVVRRHRTCPITAASTSPAGTRPTGQASRPCFSTAVET